MNNKECEKELQAALDMVKEQAYELVVIRSGLERLKTARDWQSVEEVEAFIDSLIVERDTSADSKTTY